MKILLMIVVCVFIGIIGRWFGDSFPVGYFTGMAVMFVNFVIVMYWPKNKTSK